MPNITKLHISETFCVYLVNTEVWQQSACVASCSAQQQQQQQFCTSTFWWRNFCSSGVCWRSAFIKDLPISLPLDFWKREGVITKAFNVLPSILTFSAYQGDQQYLLTDCSHEVVGLLLLDGFTWKIMNLLISFRHIRLWNELTSLLAWAVASSLLNLRS